MGAEMKQLHGVAVSVFDPTQQKNWEHEHEAVFCVIFS